MPCLGRAGCPIASSSNRYVCKKMARGESIPHFKHLELDLSCRRLARVISLEHVPGLAACLQVFNRCRMDIRCMALSHRRWSSQLLSKLLHLHWDQQEILQQHLPRPCNKVRVIDTQ
eukprot:1299805-Amphidinium_carterae.1